MAAGVIVLSEIETGTVADILQGTRLQTVPMRGRMTFFMSASDNNLTDNYTASIQLPDGRTPMTAGAVLVPQGQLTAGTVGIMDDRLMLAYEAVINQGGHVVFGCTETGDSEFFWRIVYRPGG